MNPNKKIVHLIIVVSLLFLSIIGYLTYFQIFQAAGIINNPYNRRQWAREDNTIRGNIYDRRGVPLATSEVVGDRPVRNYPHNNLYSHVIGYSYKQYGRAGLENHYNQQLMALFPESPVARIREQLTTDMVRGNNLVLTIDHELQRKVEGLMRGRTGSAVAINPTTGEVLAMVSKPDFNPTTLVADWNTLINDERSPLINRSTVGLYPPGSTYKVIMAAAILENPHILEEEYDCEGSIVIDGYRLSDYGGHAHGKVDLKDSLVVSCNTNFARMTVELGEGKTRGIAKRFFVGTPFKSDVPISASRFPAGTIPTTDLAAIGIGQGKLLATPIHMALIAGTFANDGVMMPPYLVAEVQNPQGRVLNTNTVEGIEIVSHEIAGEVRDMMIAAVNRGTGRRAAIPGTVVGGKTGTAENATGRSHAWFIGFADRDETTVAVAVILESAGETGGAAAAPIAGEIMKEALRRGVGN
ncbi:MAG: peptidoglycan glycosyltransferase [Clostridiaceae bacterium]|nr:peptidoglycan glycosyltransferase [Clostridiaceae bacterium]